MSGKDAPYQWIHTVDYEDFDRQVLDASHERSLLVDLWAEWCCSPCVVIAPVLERVIAGYGGRVHLAKVEVDAGRNLKLGGHVRVWGFTTILLIEDGVERGRLLGALRAPFVLSFLSNHSIRMRD